MASTILANVSGCVHHIINAPDLQCRQTLLSATCTTTILWGHSRNESHSHTRILGMGQVLVVLSTAWPITHSRVLLEAVHVNGFIADLWL